MAVFESGDWMNGSDVDTCLLHPVVSISIRFIIKCHKVL
jgi:hypothetical protein